MQFTTLAFGLISAAAVSAYELPQHPTIVARAIEARGTDACASVASSIIPKITDYPTPPADVVEYISTATDITVTDPCVNPVITGSIGSEFTSWASGYTSWTNEHLSDFRALWQACSDVSEIASSLPTGTDACSSLAAQITSNPGAPRETGAIAAAALFAAGAVAAAM